MCVLVISINVYMGMCKCVYGNQRTILLCPKCHLHLVFETGSFTGLELTKQTKLAVQHISPFCLLSAVIASVHHHTWLFKEPWRLGEQDSGPLVWKANTLHTVVSPEVPALITKEINEIQVEGLLLLAFSLRRGSRREIAEAPALCYRTLASC